MIDVTKQAIKIYYYIRPKIIVYFEKSKSFICNFDIKHFYLCYIIFDENYTNEKTFKNTIHSYIFYQILYNKNKNIKDQS